MKYALGNMLNGAGGLNADQLALDLPFAVTKSLTAAKGPTPVFTRASGATFVGSNGLVQLADMNLALYSGAIVNNTGWFTLEITSVASGTGPDGNTSYEVTETTTTASHTLGNWGGTGSTGATSVVSGTIYTGSIFLKKVAGSVDWVQLTFAVAAFGTQYANFNISSGTIGNHSGLASTPVIEDYGNGWYRCSITATATSTLTNSANLIVAFINNTNGTTRAPSYAGSNSSKILAAMCQFEQGASSRTYRLTTTSAFHGPRFDHDPVTLASRGLLIEESRTNLSLYSGAIVQNTGWTGNATSSVSGTGPDGNSSYQISESTINGLQSIANTGGTGAIQFTPVTNGITYTGSIFVKKVAGNIDWIQLTFGGTGFGTTLYANFNIGNGTVGNSAGLASGTVPRIEDYGNGWYRLSVVATATVTTATNNVIIGFIQNTNGTNRLPSYAGSTSNQVLASMCQFEAGSFATSYIPTTTTTVVRSADVCSISGAGFTGMWNAIEGSLFTSAIFNAQVAYGVSQFITDINDGTAANRLRFFRTTANGRPEFANTSSNSLNVQITGSTALQPFVGHKYSVGFKLDDYAFYVNNSQIGTDNLGAMVASPTTMVIGDSSAGVTRAFVNGTISAIRYYRKRLPNAKLQSLTV